VPIPPANPATSPAHVIEADRRGTPINVDRCVPSSLRSRPAKLSGELADVGWFLEGHYLAVPEREHVHSPKVHESAATLATLAAGAEHDHLVACRQEIVGREICIQLSDNLCDVFPTVGLTCDPHALTYRNLIRFNSR
jgi:hypothetical protein